MKYSKRVAAALISSVLALQGMPLLNPSAAEGDLLVTDFEDGDVKAFSKRGDDDTSVIESCSEDAHDGKGCMSVTGRSEGWNGPSVSLESIGCEAGVQYIATAWVKMKWYNTVRLSMQYTDEDGVEHYDNLASVQSDGKWVQIPETKFSFTTGMKNVSIYIEGNDAADMWVDDFSLKTAPVYPIQTDIPGLKEVYNDYFKIGGAVTAKELAPKSTQDLILKHYNSITLGNELKPENMLDQKATLAYLEETGDNTVPKVKLNGAAKIILDFCLEHNIPVRGHVLVWYSQTPYWFFTDDFTAEGKLVDKATMLKRMENYIKGVFAELEKDYSDIDFYAWDVVNEAWEDGGQPRQKGKYEDSNGSSAWVAIFGDNSFIEPAFEYARKYAPKETKLYYNDYNEYMQGKQEAIMEMAESLKAKGLIDGIGLQSHLNCTNNATSEPFPYVQMYESALKKYTELGLDLQITELDVTYDPKVANGEKLQAEYYSGIMDAIVKYKDYISAVVFWGTTDDQSWRASQYPLLFDEKYQAKPCFDSIIDGIEYTTTQPTETTPKKTTTTTTVTTTTTTTTATLRGDTNCDGEVDVSDAVLLARLVAQDSDAVVSSNGKLNSEVDGKEGLSSGDVIGILRIIAKIDI